MVLTITLSILGLLVGSGAGVGLLKYAIAHAKKHQQIDDCLGSGGKRFERIEGKLDALSGKVDGVGTAVREVLVAIGERQPGAGINGDTKHGGA